MKTIYKSFKGTMATGESETIVTQDMPQGAVVVGVLFADAPSKDVSIKIVDTNGSAIVEPSNYKDWEQRQGGTYITSKKPMNFVDENRIRVVANSTEVQTADWDFEVLLVIQQQ